jgi:homoserine/homoserine lactone efflux protein
MNPELFTAFVLITIVLIITPGPIVTLIISTGATQGPRAALTTVAGTTLGNALLLTAIAFGLIWVHAHADLLFAALRWTGATYLVWLGVQAWRHAGKGDREIADTGRARFVRGVLVALSNPKTIVFFTAFYRSSSTRAWRRGRSWRRCASSRWFSPGRRIQPGRSRRAWGAHGS